MLANRLISSATGVRLHDYGCSLKVVSRRGRQAAAGCTARCTGSCRPSRASRASRIAEASVNHRPRVHGRSKYGISRTIRVVLDLLTVKFLLSYSTRPLQIFGLIGLVMVWCRLGSSWAGSPSVRLIGDRSRSPIVPRCCLASC